MEDLHLHREKVEELAERVTEFVLGIVAGWGGARPGYAVDGVYFTDDWGTQEGLLISPAMGREVSA